MAMVMSYLWKAEVSHVLSELRLQDLKISLFCV